MGFTVVVANFLGLVHCTTLLNTLTLHVESSHLLSNYRLVLFQFSLGVLFTIKNTSLASLKASVKITPWCLNMLHKLLTCYFSINACLSLADFGQAVIQ